MGKDGNQLIVVSDDLVHLCDAGWRWPQARRQPSGPGKTGLSVSRNIPRK